MNAIRYLPGTIEPSYERLPAGHAAPLSTQGLVAREDTGHPRAASVCSSLKPPSGFGNCGGSRVEWGGGVSARRP